MALSLSGCWYRKARKEIRDFLSRLFEQRPLRLERRSAQLEKGTQMRGKIQTVGAQVRTARVSTGPRAERQHISAGLLVLALVLSVLIPIPGLDSPAGAANLAFPTSKGWKNPLAGTTQFEDWGFGSDCYIPGKEHLGTDSQGASSGARVDAIASGVVRRVDSWGSEWGTAIGVEHTASNGDRFLAVYAHVNSSVSVGDSVAAGERIASVYNLGGNSHLHFGIRPLSSGDNGGGTAVKGATTCGTSNLGYVNPIPYLSARAAGSSAGSTADYEYENPTITWESGVDPKNLAPNTLYTVVIDVDITGSASWSNQRPNPVRLGTESPRDRDSALAVVDRNVRGTWLDGRRIDLDQIDTNTNGTWTVTIRTPRNTGTFTESFRAVVEGVKWMESSPIIRLTGTVKAQASAPGKPGNVTAVAQTEAAIASWTAAAPNGSPIIAYTVTAAPGNKRCTTAGTGRSCTIKGLTGGSSYTFTVTASNAVGSAASTTNSIVVDKKQIDVHPAMQPAGMNGSDGARFTGQGLDFTPNDSVSVTAFLPNGAQYPSDAYGRMIAVGADGSFGWQWYFGTPVVAGQHRIVFTDEVSGKSATVILTGEQTELEVAPAIALSPGSVTTGDKVTVTGTGFAPGEQVGITIFGPSGQAVSTTRNTVADANGDFSRSWNPQESGTWLVAATGTQSLVTVEATVVVTAPTCSGSVYNELANSRFAGMSGLEGSVVRLYSAVFLRLPDDGGFGFWMDYDSDVRQMAAHFVASPEFSDRYGLVDDEEFVSLLYCNVLGRSPDQAGFDFWTEILATQSRDSVVVEFSESAEYRIRTATN